MLDRVAREPDAVLSLDQQRAFWLGRLFEKKQFCVREGQGGVGVQLYINVGLRVALTARLAPKLCAELLNIIAVIQAMEGAEPDDMFHCAQLFQLPLPFFGEPNGVDQRKFTLVAYDPHIAADGDKAVHLQRTAHDEYIGGDFKNRVVFAGGGIGHDGSALLLRRAVTAP